MSLIWFPGLSHYSSQAKFKHAVAAIAKFDGFFGGHGRRDGRKKGRMTPTGLRAK